MADSAVRRLDALASQFGANVTTVWAGIPQAPADPILGVGDAFRKDTDPRKVNLGVGAYRTEEGKPLVLAVVKKAEQRVLNDPTNDKEYLPITGNATFCRLSRLLAFGASSSAVQQGRIVTIQSLSGTGSLRVGTEFLAAHYPGPKVAYVPQPTWGNHHSICRNSGLEARTYRYWDPSTKGLDFVGMCADLEAAPQGAVVILHACAHNPTGVDPTQEQWRALLELVQRKQLLPFFDSAYQGFASGDLDKDAASLRMFTEAGLELLLAQSFAKNMGMYGERIGALSVVCAQAANTTPVESQLKQVVRAMYSNPPRHGASIVATVLGDEQLCAEWKVELRGMAERILSMRAQLHAALLELGVPGNWDHIIKQIGMFSYTGLTRPQVEHITAKWHVYLTMDGRISMAGLSSTSCRYLAQAIDDAVRNH